MDKINLPGKHNAVPVIFFNGPQNPDDPIMKLMAQIPVKIIFII
jgi:hypothetical protein